MVFSISQTSQLAMGSDADKTQTAKIKRLEKLVEKLGAEVDQLKKAKTPTASSYTSKRDVVLKKLQQDVNQLKSQPGFGSDSWLNKFTLGGYGEMHANFTEGSGADKFDIHRLVLYVGYEFEDWIKFHSETEIEHAFVTDGAGGELVIEQAYVDFSLSQPFNIRIGRILTPLGIINKKHEPPFFNGVERPSFSKYIIPSTWSSDGIGIFGSIAEGLSYEAYIVGGLDGSEFSSKSGIRDGRMKERPGLHEPAVTGRLDYYPLSNTDSQELRIGVSGYYGEVDNGNKGSTSGIDADIHIYSADFEYSIFDFDFRGVVADIQIDGAKEIGNGTADEIFGYYLEGAYHFWPECFKTGKLKSSDAIAFVRFDDFDTQDDMPTGILENPAADRSEWTFGFSFFPTQSLVLKADYQMRDDKSDDDLADLINFGIGWAY